MKIIPLLFIGALILLLLLSGLYRPIGKIFAKLLDDAAGAVMDDEDEDDHSKKTNRKDESI